MRAAALALLLLSGCGYRLAAKGAPLAGGVTHVFVPPFENRTGDAEAGAFVAAALREELSRRDAIAGAESAARIEGVVEATTAAPSTAAATGTFTWRLGMVVTARLLDAGKPVAEARIVREEEFLTGQDPLETEGRRRVALRRAATAAARDVVERFEAR
jgi:hypothetical protein